MAKAMTLDDYVGVTKWAFQGLATQAIVAEIIVVCPFVATPVIKQLVSTAVSYLVGQILKRGEIATFFIYTDFRVSAQGKAFNEAIEKHQEILKTGTADEKAKSEKEVMVAFSNLVRLTT